MTTDEQDTRIGMLERTPERPESTHCWLLRCPKSPSLARQLLRELLAELKDGAGYREVGELLLSELVTNAVLHARWPRRLILVTFEVTPDRLRIEVHDGSCTPVTECEPGELDESGRGLLLVKTLSQAWGCHPRRGGFGKITWFELGHAAEWGS